MQDYSYDALTGNILGNKYQIERQLANKGGRKTLLAKDIQQDTLVVVKLLSFDRNLNWDDLKLFEREAQTLKSLSHPAIPKYLDYLEIDTPNIKGFALVQEYIRATSLAAQIESGRSFYEAEIKEIATAILEILEYLHSRQPAVIHRDIKPSNILLANRSGNTVGQIYLIDFGSVQNVVNKSNTTITVVGTYGYMPPEQFGGRAKPASDIYSLGATLIYLVTGEHPADLPETDLKIEFEELCNLSPGLINWLKKITNPSLSSRLGSATQALQELADCELYSHSNKKFIRPINSKINLNQNRDRLTVIIPPKHYSWSGKSNTIGLLIFCLLPWIIFILALLFGISLGNILDTLPEYAGVLIIATLGSVGLSYQLFKPLFTTQVINIDATKALFTYQLFGKTTDYIFARSRNTIKKITKNTVNNIDRVSASLSLHLDDDRFEIVNNYDYPVGDRDIDWLAEELSSRLNIAIEETNIDRQATQQAKVYLNKAYEFHNRNNYRQAIEFYDLALHLDPQSYDAYLYRASANIEIQNYQGAVEDSYLALELNPDSAKAYCGRGVAFYYLKDNIGAIRDCDRALEIDPKHLNAYYYAAASYVALKNYPAAIDYCNRALEINPRYSYAYLMKGKAYLGLQDYPAAIKNCGHALKFNSQLEEVYSIRGFAYCYSGKETRAESDFAMKVRLDATANNYYNLGVTQLTIKMYPKALQSLNSCLQRDRQFKFAYYARANVYWALSDRERAKQDFQTAINLESTVKEKGHLEDEHGYYARGLAQYQIGDNSIQAIENLKVAQEVAAKHQYQVFENKICNLLEEIEK